jgi:CubicO group peptidase (beta-lactamase class C family)
VKPLVDPSGRRADTAPGMAVAVVTSAESSVVGVGATQLNGHTRPDGRTTFGIASVSKALTGLMLADEVSNNGMRLSDPAARYLGRDLPLSSAITLEHLVTHRSGLVNFPSNLVDRNGDGIRDATIPAHSPAADYTRRDLARGIESNALPDQRFAYSNLGAGLAAIALQDHLGLPSFDAVLQRRLVTPLRLQATGTNTPPFTARVQRQSATGYMLTQRGLQAVPFSDMGVLAGSGEVITCGDDMLQILQVLTGLGRSPLERAAQEATRSLAAGGRNKTIGYAIDIDGSGANAVYSKSGSCAGYSAHLVFRRSNPPVGVVVLVNRGGLTPGSCCRACGAKSPGGSRRPSSRLPTCAGRGRWPGAPPRRGSGPPLRALRRGGRGGGRDRPRAWGWW